ncbi:MULTISPECIES: hypothetical protein [Brevibacterium]|uniref:Uncharacterized protein n=2 Tax=Brevibacterium TaxID=1696 RepID=A0A1H1QGG5_BRESA|nr:hypothetical protein [Brevibacterium sandarakinum]SDS22506.1 hypothetical protein SAMN04489751_1520 [Brevibacterium sandarakinum]
MTTAPPTPPFHQNNENFPQKPQFKPHVPFPDGPRKSRRHIWFGLGGVVIGAGFVGGIVGINAAVESSEQAAQADLIAEVYEVCSLDSADGAFLSSDEMSITFDGVGEYDGPDVTDLHCVGVGLDMPDSVTSRMGQTRALDGTQTSDWDTFTVSWNYHPDNGLGAVFEFVPPAD